MVYSVVFVPSEKLLQLKSFINDSDCSDYHNFVATLHPDALIHRTYSLSRVFSVVKSLSINLKE